LFAREGCYLALEPHFPYRNGRDKAPPANRPPPKPRDVCSKAQFNFYLLDKSHAADRD
jgi:hypothetical protein